MSQTSVEYTEFQVVEEHLFQEIELESIVKLQFNEETLKKNFEVLIRILRELKVGVSKSNARSSKNEAEIDKLAATNAILKDDVAQLKADNAALGSEVKSHDREIEALKQRVAAAEDVAEEQKNTIEAQQQDIAAQKEAIAAQQHDIHELKKDNDKNKDDIAFLIDELNKLRREIAGLREQLGLLPTVVPVETATDNNSGVDRETLARILADLDDIRNNYVKKPVYETQCAKYDADIEKIFEELAKLKNGLDGLSDLQDSLADLMQRIKNVENSLKDKVSYDIFEEEINRLKMLIASLGSGDKKDIPAAIFQQNGLSAREAALLKELDKRVGDLEEALRALRQDFNNHRDEYGEFANTTNTRLDKLEALFAEVAALSKLKDALERLAKQHDKLDSAHAETSNLAHANELKIKELRRLLELLQDQLSRNTGQTTVTREVIVNNTPSGGNSGVSEEYVEMRLKQLRDELMKLINALRDELGEKASLQDLYKSEALVLKKVDQVTEALLKKCADKQETKKALVYLEKKINQLFAFLQELKSAQGNNAASRSREEDALISRRPLLPWSCVSCDKGLDDYNGRLGEHKYWGVFPPKETTPERLGKFGKSFRYMQEKQLIREKQFEKQKLATSSQKFFNRFSNLPGQQSMVAEHNPDELPNIHVKNN